MKNIYQDNDAPQKGENISSGSFEFENNEAAEEKKQPPKAPVISRKTANKTQQPVQQPQQPVQQPQYAQPAAQQPYYYVPVQPSPYQPVYQPNVPIQLTPEQLAAIIQQYAVPQQYVAPQPYVAPQQSSGEVTDSGMRVLYQSADFDKPVQMSEENYDDYSPDEYYSSEETASEKTPAKNIPVDDVDFEIEEETISMPARKPEPPRTSLKIEEMEMSTFELNSILSRQTYGQVKPASRSTAPQQHRDPQPKNDNIPLNFGNSFEIEETVNEVVTDISSDSKAEKDKKKKLPLSEIIRRCVLGVSIVAIVIAAAMLLNEYRLSKENDNLEEGISDLIISVADEPTTEKKDNNDKTTTKKDETSTTAPLTPEQQWAQIQAEYPNMIFPVGIQLKYAKLYATNKDFVGYLEAPGVKLSLPIVQGKDDNAYLNKNFYGKSTKYGCPFVTHLNNIVDLDQNTIIFGHHMNNGTVFGALDAYKKIDGFKAAPVITFNTLYKDYSWKVIAAFITNAYEKDDNGYVFKYYFTALSTQDRFAAFLNELSQRSLYDTGVDVLPTDKLLTLSTCSHEFEDARFVVVARLVRNGESTDVDVTKATVNPNPRYPQAYYSKKKTTNPYANAYRWEVG